MHKLFWELSVVICVALLLSSTSIAQDNADQSVPTLSQKLSERDIVEKARIGDELFWKAFHEDDNQMAVQGVKLLQEAAAAKNPRAEYDLSNAYSKGLGVEKADKTKALEFLRESALAGYAVAQDDLGSAYGDGDLGVAENGFLAYMWYWRSAQQGYKDGEDSVRSMEDLMTPDEIIMARRFAPTWVPEQSQPQSLNVRFPSDAEAIQRPEPLLRRAADAGNTAAEYQLGEKYLQTNRTELGLGILEKAANAGDADSADTLGWLYGGYDNVTANLAESKKWYDKYDKLQAIQSQIDYKNLTFVGVRKEELVNAALLVKQWEDKAQDHDNVAEFNLGIAYLKGMGVKADPVKSYMWFMIAARNGYTLAFDAMSNVSATPEQENQAMNLMQQWEQEHPR